MFEQGGYRLRVEPGELDAALFESMAAEAEDVGARDPDRCVEVARGALALWRGMPYDGVDIPVIVDGAARLAEALEAYQRARRAAADELGLELGPELRELERRVLNGEPDQLSDATR